MKKYIIFIKNKTKAKEENKHLIVDYVSSFPVIVTYMHIFLESKDRSKIYYTKTENFSKFDRLKIINRKFDFVYNKLMQRLGVKKWHNYNIDKSNIHTLLNKINSKDELVDMKINNIKIGDLIYNTYIRWSGEATVNLKSKLLKQILYETYQLYYYSLDCFSNLDKNKFKYIAGDTAYIYSGITARVAINLNIKTYSIVETEGLSLVELKPPYYYRNHEYSKYLYEFSLLSKQNKKDIYKKSHIEIKKIFNGVSTYSYMKENPYHHLTDKTIIDKLKYYFQDNQVILIMLHDFMDSPHLYKKMIYPDFYTWIISTLDYFKNINVKVMIKPHPNGLPENKLIINKLIKLYPEFYFLESNVSNKTLLDFGIDFMMTVYGSAGYEFSYYSVPVISAGDNPHSSYSFVNTCLTEKKYFYTIDKFLNKEYHKIKKNEIYEFYYMHYLRKSKIMNLSPIYPTREYIKYFANKSDNSYVTREKYAKTTNILLLDMRSNNFTNNFLKNIFNV